MRALLHLGTSALLLFSFAQSPFQHAHASEPHHEHARGFAHIHWDTTNPEGPVWESDDHDSDVRLIDWVAGAGKSAASFVGVLRDTPAETVLALCFVPIPELSPRNHDPPAQLIPYLRGPPA